MVWPMSLRHPFWEQAVNFMTFCHQNVRLIARIDFDPRDSHHSIYQFKFIHRMNENLIQECQYLIYFCFYKDAIHSFKLVAKAFRTSHLKTKNQYFSLFWKWKLIRSSWHFFHESWIYWAFHPTLVTSFLVVFGDKVTKILRNSLFIFHFVLPILPCKRKTLHRKSRNLSDEKPKSKLPKYVMSRV